MLPWTRVRILKCTLQTVIFIFNVDELLVVVTKAEELCYKVSVLKQFWKEGCLWSGMLSLPVYLAVICF